MVQVCDLLQLSDRDAIDEHVFDLYTFKDSDSRPHDLGYISRDQKLKVQVLDEEFTVEQSPSLLSSNSIASTTGFVTWKVTPLFLEWLVSFKNQPFYPDLQSPKLKILELGSGISGVALNFLSSRCVHYVASDRKELLKLLKQNIISNTPNFNSSTILQDSSTNAQRSSTNSPRYTQIDVVDLDWEDPDSGINDLDQLAFTPDLIILCDTIYNEYLIPHFLSTLRKTLTPDTQILVALQLRDVDVIETFLIKS